MPAEETWLRRIPPDGVQLINSRQLRFGTLIALRVLWQALMETARLDGHDWNFTSYRRSHRLPRSGRYLPRYASQEFRGLGTFLRLGPEIDKSVAARPDGLQRHERIYYSLVPIHVGMRQYWRDFESLEKWTRELPHQRWWKTFLAAPRGTTFWHET